jgi:hypothetical protein
MACISVLGPSSTISSAHAGEATPVSPNFTPSVPIVRLLRIVLLYLLYKRVDNFAPCRIPYAMLILSVRLLSHLYTLLGSGLHARSGMSPVVLMKIWNTYVVPRFLYDLEVQNPTKTDIKKLEQLQQVTA